MDKEIWKLLDDCLPTLAMPIKTEIEKPFGDFETEVFPRLSPLDEQIPGVGMHYAVWDNGTPWFPFDLEFDGIVRPLSYVPYNLAGERHPQTMSRYISMNLGGHVEECLKEFCSTLNLKYYTPVGKCVNWHRSSLGSTLAQRIQTFFTLSWNRGKHLWNIRKPDSVIPIEDSLACYFIARYLGATILEKCNRLDSMVAALNYAREQGKFYNRPTI
jgi:hypothetical protein